ncbi:MAG: KilA-N domain-containing protein [Nostoc sp.]|uniref:KilA-N domain-containing protein n=1 Tax=Nostoc sp. TaxID=1180 RepID=UPI002FFD2925
MPWQRRSSSRRSPPRSENLKPCKQTFLEQRGIYMSQIEQFGKLVQDARRDDGYINATEWCKRFGYRLDSWKQLPETKARSKHLKIAESNTEPWIVERVGKTWVTWVHPIMAVHLASYLDPGFANHVAEIFIRYAVADPTLAADIASRQNTVEGLDVINKAVQKQWPSAEADCVKISH